MALILSLEGNIGSGKSTFIKKLDGLLESFVNKPIVLLQEPIDVWSTFIDKNGETILEKFYKDQNKYAFSFQMMTYISRLELLNKTIKENPNKIIICERSIWTDKRVFAQMLADDNKIEEIDFIIYNKWFDNLSKNIKLDGIIYLKTSPENCKHRIGIRDRKGENISLEYLTRCDEYHNKWLEDVRPIQIIDGNIVYDTISHKRLEIISNFITNVYNAKYLTDTNLSNIFDKMYC